MGGNPDWTFEQNGDRYSTKVLMVCICKVVLGPAPCKGVYIVDILVYILVDDDYFVRLARHVYK